VGQHLLKELLSSSQYTRVAEYGRRLTDPQSLTGKEKLEQHIVDFEKLEESGLKNHKWDVVFITLGTTRNAAGSAQAFEKIDREYVINAAREAKAEGHDQRLVYVSVGSANPNSMFLYIKSKGLTELGLAALGYKDTIIFRPALLVGLNRPEPRFMENMAGYVTGFLGKFHRGLEIQVPTLAKAIRLAGTLGSSQLPEVAQPTKEGPEGGSFTVLSNKGALALAATEA